MSPLTYENVIAKIQTERGVWAANNFPNAGLKEHALGVAEEAGELAHAVLKMAPGTGDDGAPIRGSRQDHLDEAADALGDLFIYMCGVATDLGLSLSDCIITAWGEVQWRDWVKYPETGRPPRPPITSDNIARTSTESWESWRGNESIRGEFPDHGDEGRIT